MEKYISAEDVMTNIKAYRKSLSYDDQFDFEMETKRMRLSDKRREKLDSKQSALEFRLKKYGIHKNKNKAA
jgi:hypothetical protein